MSPKAETFFTWLGRISSTLALPVAIWIASLVLEVKERVTIIETRSEITRNDHDLLVKLEVRVDTLEKQKE